MYDDLKPWHEVLEAWDVNPFLQILDFLTEIGIDGDIALSSFTSDYWDALTWYDSIGDTQRIMQATLSENRLLYDAMIDGMPYAQIRTKTRTPDLTRSTTGSSSGSSTAQRNQTVTTTDTPNNYRTTSINSVNPYDNPGWQDDRKNETTETGSRSTTTSYTGTPDTASSTMTGSMTESETGTDTTTETITGSMDPAAAAELIELGLTVFGKYKKDLAKRLFFQVWR
jgi:hypothetical protein